MRPLPDELAKLRQRMRAMDRAILSLVAQRQRTAKRIGQVKRKKGLPLRNYEVEAQAIKEARKLCKQHRLAPELGDELMRALIEASVKVQEDGR